MTSTSPAIASPAVQCDAAIDERCQAAAKGTRRTWHPRAPAQPRRQRAGAATASSQSGSGPGPEAGVGDDGEVSGASSGLIVGTQIRPRLPPALILVWKNLTSASQPVVRR